MVSDWTIGGINLPLNPTTIDEQDPATIQSSNYPSELPLLISLGKKARVLVLEGWIREHGQTKTYLDTTYVIPLRNLLYTEVAVAGPRTLYDGNYLLNKLTIREEPGIVAAYRFRIELWMGHIHLVI